MPDKTPNHELNRYEPGDTDWTHTPDMETIEEQLPIRDELANIDEYEPYDGAIYWATDNGEPMFAGDGTEWSLANMEVAELDAETVTTEDLESETLRNEDGERDWRSNEVFSTTVVEEAPVQIELPNELQAQSLNSLLYMEFSVEQQYDGDWSDFSFTINEDTESNYQVLRENWESDEPTEVVYGRERSSIRGVIQFRPYRATTTLFIWSGTTSQSPNTGDYARLVTHDTTNSPDTFEFDKGDAGDGDELEVTVSIYEAPFEGIL